MAVTTQTIPIYSTSPFNINITGEGKARCVRSDAVGNAVWAYSTGHSYGVQFDFNQTGSEHSYTIDSMCVGEKMVRINGGQKIYYSNGTTVRGFETGKKSNFEFYSATEAEKSMGMEPDSHNISNIIECTVITYKRIRHVEPEPEVQFRSMKPKSISKCPPRYRSLDASNGFTGGATLSGNKFCSHVSTRTTKDRFVKVNTYTFKIQLVCEQSDAEKAVANRRYLEKNRVFPLRSKLSELESNIAISQQIAQKRRDKLTKYQQLLADAESEIANYIQEQTEIEAKVSEEEASLTKTFGSSSDAAERVADESSIFMTKSELD